MIKFNERQFEIEKNYIEDKYFSDFRIVSSLESTNKHVKKANALLNNIPYTFYKFGSNNAILVPTTDDLFSGDFNEIYNICFSNQYGIHFNIIRKKNSIIEMFNYDFHLKDSNFIGDDTYVMANYYNVDDSKNILYEFFKAKNLSLEAFLIRSEISEMELEKNYKYLEIRKDENGALKKYTATSLDEMLSDAMHNDMSFESLPADLNESLIKVAENILNEKELEGFKIKIKL